MTITTPAPTDWKPGRLTAFRFDTSADALAPLVDDTMDRVVIETDIEWRRAERWTSTVDAISGLPIEVRKTDCGGGCRCAVEVRLPLTPRVKG